MKKNYVFYQLKYSIKYLETKDQFNLLLLNKDLNKKLQKCVYKNFINTEIDHEFKLERRMKMWGSLIKPVNMINNGSIYSNQITRN